MALINCPECNNKVSSFAEFCPKCGCPICDDGESAVVNTTAKEERKLAANPTEIAISESNSSDNSFDISPEKVKTQTNLNEDSEKKVWNKIWSVIKFVLSLFVSFDSSKEKSKSGKDAVKMNKFERLIYKSNIVTNFVSSAAAVTLFVIASREGGFWGWCIAILAIIFAVNEFFSGIERIVKKSKDIRVTKEDIKEDKIVLFVGLPFAILLLVFFVYMVDPFAVRRVQNTYFSDYGYEKIGDLLGDNLRELKWKSHKQSNGVKYVEASGYWERTSSCVTFGFLCEEEGDYYEVSLDKIVIDDERLDPITEAIYWAYLYEKDSYDGNDYFSTDDVNESLFVQGSNETQKDYLGTDSNEIQEDYLETETVVSSEKSSQTEIIKSESELLAESVKYSGMYYFDSENCFYEFDFYGYRDIALVGTVSISNNIDGCYDLFEVGFDGENFVFWDYDLDKEYVVDFIDENTVRIIEGESDEIIGYRQNNDDGQSLVNENQVSITDSVKWSGTYKINEEDGGHIYFEFYGYADPTVGVVYWWDPNRGGSEPVEYYIWCNDGAYSFSREYEPVYEIFFSDVDEITLYDGSSYTVRRKISY